LGSQCWSFLDEPQIFGCGDFRRRPGDTPRWGTTGEFNCIFLPLTYPYWYPADPEAPQIYTFSPNNVAQFDRSQLIFRSGKTLRRGQSLEGFILASDPEPMPFEFRHGAPVTAILRIFDQFDDVQSTDLDLWVDRSAEWGRKPVAPKPRKRLFEQPDDDFADLPGESESLVVRDVEIIEYAAGKK
jgi:hypothetical protein